MLSFPAQITLIQAQRDDAASGPESIGHMQALNSVPRRGILAVSDGIGGHVV